MSIWSRLLGTSKKVGETALEISVLAAQIDGMKTHLQGIQKNGILPDDIAMLLDRVNDIQETLGAIGK